MQHAIWWPVQTFGGFLHLRAPSWRAAAESELQYISRCSFISFKEGVGVEHWLYRKPVMSVCLSVSPNRQPEYEWQAEGLHTSPLFEVVRSDNKTKYPDARKEMDLIKYMICVELWGHCGVSCRYLFGAVHEATHAILATRETLAWTN